MKKSLHSKNINRIPGKSSIFAKNIVSISKEKVAFVWFIKLFCTIRFRETDLLFSIPLQ
jgi:hypothetical protein